MAAMSMGAEQEKRVAKAVREAGDMTFTQRPNCWLVTTKRVCYVVCDRYCSCEDWQYRGSRTGVRCKHQIALGMHKLELGIFGD